ncbi:RNA exonuclease 4 [Melia azedarach]|uniref:RNA exonuclease 4 n=1 Tax=Melia azedarach TaxID=155640 RepID=A0ACC1YVP6_MELAZ|nr:RNA exonuclease 4 [Melia azedarach]
MATEQGPPKTRTTSTRHKCPACYKQFKRKDHLIEHMKMSYHSIHQPKCAVCQKHCKSFESLREHLTGPLAKENCAMVFSDQGCNLCMQIFDDPDSLSKHKEACSLSAPVPLGTSIPCAESPKKISGLVDKNGTARAVAIDCEMVGGGSDGSLDLCARVCLVDEDENVIFHAYVQPQIPVANYRSEVTGLTEERLKDAMAVNEVRDKILEILYNGESVGRLRLDGGKGRLLVGHGLEHDLNCLRMSYPDHMLRDTAKYRPLMKTNLVSHSLKYLTKTYLGYDIQSGVHDPYEDSVSVMRLYKRFRCQNHQVEEIGNQDSPGGFDSYKSKELEKMSSSELYEISRSNYKCWCQDSRQIMQP